MIPRIHPRNQTRPRASNNRGRVGKVLLWVAALLLPLVFAGTSFAESGNHNTDRPPSDSGVLVASAE